VSNKEKCKIRSRGVTWGLLDFWDHSNISGMNESRNFKFWHTYGWQLVLTRKCKIRSKRETWGHEFWDPLISRGRIMLETSNSNEKNAKLGQRDNVGVTLPTSGFLGPR